MATVKFCQNWGDKLHEDIMAGAGKRTVCPEDEIQRLEKENADLRHDLEELKKAYVMLVRNDPLIKGIRKEGETTMSTFAEHPKGYRRVPQLDYPDCCMICKNMDSGPDGCIWCKLTAYQYQSKYSDKPTTLHLYVGEMSVCDKFERKEVTE